MKYMNYILDKLKSFFKWVISNTIWTILTLLIPFTLILPTLNNIKNSIISKTYSIKLYNIIFIGLFFIIETIILIVVAFYKKRHNQIKNEKSDDNINKEDDSDEIDYKSLDYYFESYHKHLTVYANGNGIIINSFTVVINNIDSISEFKREINISDAKVGTSFPRLKIMKSTKLSDRFNKFGFWYKCLNNEDLIKCVREYYWSNDMGKIDTVAQSNPMNLKWIMEMNPSSIEVGKAYDIVYVMSIPNMFPIENGMFCENIANIKGTHGKFQSGFGVKHVMKHFKYTVSFENGMTLHTKPTGTISYGGKKYNLHYDNDNNIIFDRYIFNTSSPKCNSVINIEWNFKEKQQQKRRA